MPSKSEVELYEGYSALGVISYGTAMPLLEAENYLILKPPRSASKQRLRPNYFVFAVVPPYPIADFPLLLYSTDLACVAHKVLLHGFMLEAFHELSGHPHSGLVVSWLASLLSFDCNAFVGT